MCWGSPMSAPTTRTGSTYHPTCHSLRMLRVGDKPLSLLRAVEGIDLVELPQADVCCGFGGTFALKNAGTSSAMLADKIGNMLHAPAPRCARPVTRPA